jgi:hypothetical protein
MIEDGPSSGRALQRLAARFSRAQPDARVSIARHRSAPLPVRVGNFGSRPHGQGDCQRYQNRLTVNVRLVHLSPLNVLADSSAVSCGGSSVIDRATTSVIARRVGKSRAMCAFLLDIDDDELRDRMKRLAVP